MQAYKLPQPYFSEKQSHCFSLKYIILGVLLGLCGTSSVRFRPALLFERYHAEIVLSKLEMTLAFIVG